MSTPSDLSAPDAGHQEFKTSLRRTLIRTLILLTIVPLVAMGLAAYLRSSSLLRQQAITQMQTLISGQLDGVVRLFKVKQIRLERMANRSDLTSIIEQALHVNPRSISFNAIRQELLASYDSLVVDEENPTFNQFFIVNTEGLILISSQPAWENQSLQETPLAPRLEGRQPFTATFYDFKPLYAGQLAAFTIQPFFTSSGSYIGALVGVTEPQSLVLLLGPLIHLGPSADAYFVTSDGVLAGVDPYTSDLTRLDPSTAQAALLDSAFAGMQEAGSTPAPASLEFPLVNGEKMIAQAEWLPAMNAGVVLQMPEAVVLREINSLLPFTAVVILAAVLAMAIFMGTAINRFINPVLSLTRITQRFANGDLTERAAVRSNDEVGLLTHSFNQMADELGAAYRALEQKVEERTRQIRTAAEVAQGMTASPSIDDLINTTTRLIVERFGYYHAAIFMLDRSGKFATIRAAHGPVAGEMLKRGHSLEVGSNSIVGWVTANNQPRVASDVIDDPLHFKNMLLPDTRAEVGIPIASGELVLGALDVQSTESGVFDAEAVTVLQTLANQIAAAIQNAGTAESAQVNFQEMERLYRASRSIAQAASAADALSEVARALRDAPYVTALFTASPSSLRLDSISDPLDRTNVRSVPREIAISSEDAVRELAGGSILDLKNSAVSAAFSRIPVALGCEYAAYLPVMCADQLSSVIMIASRNERINRSALQPYASLADMASITLEKIMASDATAERLRELNALASINQTVSVAMAPADLYSAIHRQVHGAIGDHDFMVVLYDASSDTIQIPYSYEDGRISQAEALPLGESLTSLLIRKQKPLIIVEDLEHRAGELGVRLVGRGAQSWMGAPMVLQNQVVGALVVQDQAEQYAFNEDQLKFLSALSSQLAGAISNARLVQDSRIRALQLETAAEIARDISSSLNLDELLARAVNFIRERFNFYHASVFLLDLPGEFAVIREATGDAGVQLKRAGHKLGVGSKSIVGYVAGRGEPLIINDTSKDSTYYANPLLPDTRGEAATPLKVGDRILGVLDVQSVHPYAFNADNVRTLQILADQLAIAVVNSELFSETQEHLSQHRLLHHITTSAASGSTLEEALSSTVNGLQVTLGGDRVSILMLDRASNELQIKAWVGYSEDASRIRIPVGTGVTGWVAAHRRPLRLDDIREDPRYIQLSPDTRSELAIPLIYRNDLLGVLNVESEQLSAYTDNDEELLGTLGGSLAAVIANARLLEQIRAQAERERLLYDITSQIRRSTDVETILATTANELVKVLGARRARIVVNPLETPVDEYGDNGHNQGGRLLS
jgi:GAF domain-containing protein/HAMP domain-containing protein